MGGWGLGISAKNCHQPRIATNYSSLEEKSYLCAVGLFVAGPEPGDAGVTMTSSRTLYGEGWT